jgi:hypothetical protein
VDRGLQKQQEMENKAIKIESKDDADAEEQQQHQQKQPPMKVTKNRGGHSKDYNFLQSINSLDELDNFRFEVI